ncbi:MAG: LptF/LptG family permease [Cyclobacteriaceae bacterium]
MRKIDTLILKSFIGPFTLTTVVATFILLVQYMMKYFDDFVGKDLGGDVFAELLFYFSLNMLQVALPLGVLVSSLMTFGNLGEHFELTAIKSAGISLVRALRPIFFFVVLLSIAAFNFNNYVVPKANLKAYSLLYDIKHKKPALDIKPGVFYNGIPNYSIKVSDKLPDGKTLLDILIYDHTDGKGNKTVIIADSSRMFTTYNERYLKLELFNGNYYSETEKAREPVDQLFRSNFKRMDMMFNLSSFDLKRTQEQLFQNNRQMKNFAELNNDIDSLNGSIFNARMGFVKLAKTYFRYHLTERVKVEKINPFTQKKLKSADSLKKMSKVEAGFFSFLFKQDSLVIQKDKLLKKRKTKFGNVKNEAVDTLTNKETSFSKLKIKQDIDSAKLASQIIAGERRDSIQSQSSSTIAAKSKQIKTSKLKSQLSTNLNSKVETQTKNIVSNNGIRSQKKPMKLDTLDWKDLDEIISTKKSDVLLTAKNQAQNLKVNLSSTAVRIKDTQGNIYKWTIEKGKKISQAFACIVMFLIGAPLGAIIKKGGLGVPVIISIFFFLTYYVLNITCEKWAKEGLMDSTLSVWVANMILLPIGLFFLRQARIDARLFDGDIYLIWIDKMKIKFRNYRNK